MTKKTTPGRIDGQIKIIKEVHTAGEPARIKLELDRENILADRRDVVCATASILDRNDNLCPKADNLLRFNITGPGKNIGVGSGNPLSHEDNKGDKIKAFNGLDLLVVQSTSELGEIKITALSEGLISERVTVHSEK